MLSFKKRGGFTLIELLIVVAIIGLLATLAAVGLSSARMKSRDTKRVTDLKQIQKALELSFDNTTGYPVVASGLTLGTATADVLCNNGTGVVFVSDQSTCVAGKLYMGLVPANPSVPASDYIYRSTNGNGAFCTTGPCAGYCIQSSLEGGMPQNNLAAGNIMIDQSAFKNGTCP